jgi:hypothetical protein
MNKVIIPILIIASAGLLPADVLYLRDGNSVNGKLMSATSRQIRFLEDGQRAPRTYQITAVDRIGFADSSSLSPSRTRRSDSTW